LVHDAVVQTKAGCPILGRVPGTRGGGTEGLGQKRYKKGETPEKKEKNRKKGKGWAKQIIRVDKERRERGGPVREKKTWDRMTNVT